MAESRMREGCARRFEEGAKQFAEATGKINLLGDRTERIEKKLDTVRVAVVGNGNEDQSLLARVKSIEDRAEARMIALEDRTHFHQRWHGRWWRIVEGIILLAAGAGFAALAASLASGGAL